MAYFTLYSQRMGTTRRLLGFLDLYRRKLIVSLVLAWLAMAITVAIPALIGEAVDAIENGDRDSLAAAIGDLVAGLLRVPERRPPSSRGAAFW